MAPSRLQSLVLPLMLSTSTIVHGIWTNDKNLDPTLKCTKRFYDIDPQERIKVSDYEDMTAFCAAASDGRPSMGCSCQNEDGVPQCSRAKADKGLYDTAIWPPGNVTVPIDFSWSCITDCLCGADPDPPSGTPKQKEIQKALSVIGADNVAVSDVRKSVSGNQSTVWQFPVSEADAKYNPIECAGPMFDIDSRNQAVQTSDYADLTSVCAANNGKFPNMGFDCSGPGGSLASDVTKYDKNLAKYHRPPGGNVQPLIFSQLCNIMCSCPQSADAISDFASDWWNIWSDGKRTAVTVNGQTVLEYMPNGMPYGAGRSYQYELPAMQADVAAGPNVTNVDLINMNSTTSDISGMNSTTSDISGFCDPNTGACEGDSCQRDDDCSNDGFLYCDTSIGSCVSNGTLSGNDTLSGNGNLYCDPNTGACEGDSCQTDKDCSQDGHLYCDRSMGSCVTNGTLSGSGITFSNDTYYCETDTDCSEDGSVTCDTASGQCIINGASISNGTVYGNETSHCKMDEDCSTDGSAFCDTTTGECVFDTGNIGDLFNSTDFNSTDFNGSGNATFFCNVDEDCSTDGSAFCDTATGVCAYSTGNAGDFFNSTDFNSTFFSNSTGNNSGTTVLNGVAEITIGSDQISSGNTPTPVAQPGNHPKKLKRRFVPRAPLAPTPAPTFNVAHKSLHRRRKVS